MPQSFALVRDVNPSTSIWAMRLRVVRAYQVPAFGNGNQVSSYEVIFHDKENERIHATIKAHAMKNLSTVPAEGRLYAVKDFLVAENRMKFRTTTSTMKIIFLRKTRIEEVFDETFPNSTFIFKSFKDFEALKDTPQFDLFDVIGKLKSCQISPTQTAKGMRLEFQIQDLDQTELSCTLWDNYADSLLPYIDNNSAENVVVIIQFGRMSVFGGQIKFANTFNVTKVLVNGDAQEFADFNIKLEDAGIFSTTISTFENSTVIALADDFNSGQAVVKNIVELTSYSEAGVFWVPATIVEIEVLTDWCYLACKNCSKKLTPVNGVYFCSKCVRTERAGIYRYKIEVSVLDESGCATFILWDNECIQLIGKTAAQVKEANEETFDYVPKEVEEALADRVGLFNVQVREGDYLRESVSYSVVKMTDNKNILGICKEKYVGVKASNSTNAIEDDDTTMTTSIVCCDDEIHDAVQNVDDEIITMKMAANDINEFGGGTKRKRIMKKGK